MQFNKSKKGSTALGVVGVIGIIIIFNIGMGLLFNWLGKEVQKKDFELVKYSNCDCGVIGCIEYQLIFGEEATVELCQSQQTSPEIAIITAIKEYPSLDLFVGVLNIMLLICIVIIIRGGSG